MNKSKTVAREKHGAGSLERLVMRHFDDILAALHSASQYESSYADAWKGADKRIARNSRQRAKRYLKVRQKLCDV